MLLSKIVKGNYIRKSNIRNLFIQTANTPNPHSLKFLPGKRVLPEDYTTGVDFTPNAPDLNRSKLAKELFKIDGVLRVFFGNDFVSITKLDVDHWDGIKPQVFSAIMEHYASGEAAVLDDMPITDTTILEDDDEVVAMIKELLESRIRPAVQEDGGDIFYKGFEDGIVKLQLGGACAGCPSSMVTLKNGVQNMLMHYVPEVKGILEVTEDALEDLNKKEMLSFEEKLKQAGIPTE